MTKRYWAPFKLSDWYPVKYWELCAGAYKSSQRSLLPNKLVILKICNLRQITMHSGITCVEHSLLETPDYWRYHQAILIQNKTSIVNLCQYQEASKINWAADCCSIRQSLIYSKFRATMLLWIPHRHLQWEARTLCCHTPANGGHLFMRLVLWRFVEMRSAKSSLAFGIHLIFNDVMKAEHANKKMKPYPE